MTDQATSESDRPSIGRVTLPSLDDLDRKLAINNTIGAVLTMHGPREQPHATLANSIARLADKVVDEYELARPRLAAGSGRNLTDLLRGIGHMETSIHTLHRALGFVDALRRKGLKYADGKPLIPRPKDLELLQDASRGMIRRIRDAMEHADRDIIRDSGEEGEYVMLAPLPDRFAIRGKELTYEDLARWIRQLHGLADRINGYRSTNPSP